MSDWPIGLSTGSFYQISIFECLEPIRKGGFGMVEVCSSPAHLNYHDRNLVGRAEKKMKHLGLEPYSFHAPFLDVDISSPDRSIRELSCHEVLLAAEAAAILGARHFVIHPGPDSATSLSAEERMERLRNTADVLDRVAQRCTELGVGLVLENMLPHLPLGSTSDMLWIMGAMHSLNVSTCLDTGHASLSGDIYSIMFKLSAHLGIVHADDNAGHSDDHLPPGQGTIDWRRVVYELSEADFRGGVILELTGMRNGNMERTLEDARRARLFLRSIAREVYLSRSPGAPRPRPAQGSDREL